jgi:alanyl aminopeptidase
MPVCVAYDRQGERHRACTVLTSESANWVLPDAKVCPAWVAGNADASGYYHVRYEGDLLQKVLAGGGRHLSAAERVSTIGDVAALVRSGDLPAGSALRLVPEFSHDPNRYITNETIAITESVRQTLVPEDMRSNYSRFVTKMYGDRAIRLGWKRRPGENTDTTLMRPSVVGLVAREGNVAALKTEARALARQWLKDREGVEQDVLRAVLDAAAANGDEALFDEFVAAAKASKDEKTRGMLLRALGAFRDPALAKRGMNLVLGSDFDTRESITLLFGPLRNIETRELPFQFVKANYDVLTTKVGSSMGDFDPVAMLPMTAAGYCSADKISEVRDFFGERMKTRVGGPRNLDQAIERIGLCDSMRKAQQAGVREFLSGY